MAHILSGCGFETSGEYNIKTAEATSECGAGLGPPANLSLPGASSRDLFLGLLPGTCSWGQEQLNSQNQHVCLEPGCGFETSGEYNIKTAETTSESGAGLGPPANLSLPGASSFDLVLGPLPGTCSWGQEQLNSQNQQLGLETGCGFETSGEYNIKTAEATSESGARLGPPANLSLPAAPSWDLFLGQLPGTCSWGQEQLNSQNQQLGLETAYYGNGQSSGTNQDKKQEKGHFGPMGSGRPENQDNGHITSHKFRTNTHRTFIKNSWRKKYSNLPPRFRKDFLIKNGLTLEDVESDGNRSGDQDTAQLNQDNLLEFGNTPFHLPGPEFRVQPDFGSSERPTSPANSRSGTPTRALNNSDVSQIGEGIRRGTVGKMRRRNRTGQSSSIKSTSGTSTISERVSESFYTSMELSSTTRSSSLSSWQLISPTLNGIWPSTKNTSFNGSGKETMRHGNPPGTLQTREFQNSKFKSSSNTRGTQNMRRGKPPQELYKPGSFKLRRSNQGTEDTLCDTGGVRSDQSNFDPTSEFTPTAQKGDNRDLQRRPKKPERELYVPRAVVQAREQHHSLNFQNQNFGLETGALNDSNLHNEKMRGSKRYSSNRNNNDNNSGKGNGEWQDKSPNRNNYRMRSEPRGGFSNGPSWNRDRHRERDTRSVEPTGIGYRNNNPDGGKIQAKPPSGRRHSTIGNYNYNELDKKKNLQKTLENLPPRFRKKFMNANGLTSEDFTWDGSDGYPDPQQRQDSTSYHSIDSYNTLPHSTASPNYNNPSVGYYTLPSRPRGRGRFHHPDPEFKPGPAFRSVTPELPNIHRSPANSRPGTPTRRFDSRPPSRPQSRSQTPHSYYEDNKYSNDSWGDNRGDKHYNAFDEPSRGAKKPIVLDGFGSRASEIRHLESTRDSSQQESDQRRSARNQNDRRSNNKNYGGDDKRNNRRGYNDIQDIQGDGDRNLSDKVQKDQHRKNERRKRNSIEKRTSSRDFARHDTKESFVINNDSNKTVTSKYKDENKVPQSSSFVPTCFEEVKSNSVQPLVEIYHEANTKIFSGNRDILDWNEEVELNNRLEAEAFSDAITRSSSVTSLQEISTKSMPAFTDNTPSTKKKRKSGRKKSKQRSGSGCRDKTPSNTRDRKDSVASVESRDNFQIPFDEGTKRNGRRRKRSSRNHRDLSFERLRNKSRDPSRDASFDRNQENWRDEIIRSRQNSEREGSSISCRVSTDRSRKNSEYEDQIVEMPSKKGGILVMPSNLPVPTLSNTERPVFPDIKKTPQKTLFDPKNPNKPILVKSPGNRIAVPGFSENNLETPKLHSTDPSGKAIPTWYYESSEDFQSSHFPDLLRDIKRADTELQFIMSSGLLLVNYEVVDNLRQFLKSALEFLLCKAIKFCQKTNVEQHIWKMLYYNIIEMTRKAIVDDPDNKKQYKGFLLFLIDEGMTFFENIISALEDSYNFKVIDYIGNNSMVQQKDLGLTKLALVSAQKIFLFMGDLGRYREQVNETANYGKCRQWYIKSHEINPKNGKPYNQLAVLAVYSKRRLDAFYYYMRSLMSSNPVQSASESLTCLFDENRKRYEQSEKKRREERLERQRQHMKEKESEKNGVPNFLRKETWIHPDGSRRLHRTTKAFQEEMRDSEEEDLASLSSVNVNKRFVISYLHVHGKLFTKIGLPLNPILLTSHPSLGVYEPQPDPYGYYRLESFQDTAMQMLKEFRALLQHSPVPLPCNRFLQLLALNMFTIETTQLKDPNLQRSPSYRSELQERALIVSLQMFNLILEQCVSILQAHFNACLCDNEPRSPLDTLPHDANVLLPAVKVWCDWMLCHASVWNPPPSTGDFKVGPPGDLWSRLGLLMNILGQLHPDSLDIFVNEPREGYEPVRLPEDATLSGFTPLFYDREASFAPSDLDSESAQLRLRISKLLFFGTVYLCGLEPPVLKLEIVDGRKEYVSVVQCGSSYPDSPTEDPVLTRHDEVLLETFSGDEEDIVSSEPTKQEVIASLPEASLEVKHLLNRKLELEEKNRNQELHRQQVMKILSQSVVSVHLEIRPKYLVPDTNCFIDHLDTIQAVAKSNVYTFMVPIVVLSELEGLSKGASPFTRDTVNPKVAVSSRKALEFLKIRHLSVKCVTTKGAILASTNFSTEDSASWDVTMNNDDKILTTCLVLCKNSGKEEQNVNAKEGEPRHLFREVVLLTEDRNLRVKAHARDVPVRSLHDFMHWAGVAD